MSTFIFLTLIGWLLGFLYIQAKKYGNGSLWLGLKRFLDPSYERPEVETARIQEGLNDLFSHLTREYGPGWRLTVLCQSGHDNQIVVEKLYQWEELRDTFYTNENYWSGDDTVERFVEENVLEPLKKEN